MTEGVLLSKDELKELTGIRLAVDSVQRMLDAATREDDISVTDAASLLQPITRWLDDFVDNVYKRTGPLARASEQGHNVARTCPEGVRL